MAQHEKFDLAYNMARALFKASRDTALAFAYHVESLEGCDDRVAILAEWDEWATEDAVEAEMADDAMASL